MRTSRLAALDAARHHITLAGPVQDQVIPAASTNSTPGTTALGTSGSGQGSTGSGQGSTGSGQGTTGSSPSGSTTGSSVGSTSGFLPAPPVTNPGAPVSANPLPVNVSTLLGTIYSEYENGILPSPTVKAGQVEIQGSNVGVQFQTSNASDFATMMADAESLGLQVTVSSAGYGIVDGYLPIAELPAAAQLAGSPSLTPLLYPLTN
jgi:hypothetical protein